MCLEPLLRNIHANNEITGLTSEVLDTNLPKAYAYADDLNACIKNSEAALQALFWEYERLTNLSGLELNAEKTELLRIKKPSLMQDDNRQLVFRIRYLNKYYTLRTQDTTKITGITLCQDIDRMVNINVETVVKKMEKIFKSWSARQLSTLGKILITKTFGISQLTYLLQTISLEEHHFKILNKVLYKFIWNRNFLAAKAPERISRDVVNKSIKLGGLGMLSIVDLDNSLKLRALGRILQTKHPFLSILRGKIDFLNFFNPSCPAGIDRPLEQALRCLSDDRKALLQDETIFQNRVFIGLIKNLKVADVTNRRGHESVPYMLLRNAGKLLIKDLSRNDLIMLSPFMDRRYVHCFLRTANLIDPGLHDEDRLTYFIKGKAMNLADIKSRQFRLSRSDNTPICIFKIGLIIQPQSALSWFHRINKLTSTKHKNMILKICHGDVYTKERLVRFNMAENPNCPRCNDLETLEHKFVTCDYVNRIWQEAARLTKLTHDPSLEPLENIMMVRNEATLSSLTLHAEILYRIHYLNSEQNYLVRPRNFVTNALKHLLKLERNILIKNDLVDLLDR